MINTESTNVIDGRALRDEILAELKSEIKTKKLAPILAIIQVGNNEASNRYINQKIKFSQEIGAKVDLINLPETVSQGKIEDKIKSLNQDQKISGIIVQLPLPKHLNQEKVVDLIKPEKDVDGLTENSLFKPATPSGVMKILEKYNVTIKGKIAVVLGRSKLVGKPIKEMLEARGAKVIQIHSQTPKPIDQLVQQGDIIVSAVGQPKLITASMVKKGAVVIDVGINRDSDTGKLVGDVDFKKVKEKASFITPVPGGVGPMTVAMLLQNLVTAASLK